MKNSDTNDRFYNFFIDDNIFFLTDIARERPDSLFDHFYLKGLRDLHRQFGTKFVLNLFFENHHEPFTLTEVPDAYRAEWQENASWLKLAFHAWTEFPAFPYAADGARADQLPQDYLEVKKQVLRFAGEASFCPPTIIHYYSCTAPEAKRFLKEQGVSVLALRESDWPESESKTNLFFDDECGFFRIKVDFFCNNLDSASIVENLQKKIAAGQRFIDIGTHEQYFFKRYAAYIPDHFARLEKALQTVTDAGYKSEFFHIKFAENQVS